MSSLLTSRRKRKRPSRQQAWICSRIKVGHCLEPYLSCPATEVGNWGFPPGLCPAPSLSLEVIPTLENGGGWVDGWGGVGVGVGVIPILPPRKVELVIFICLIDCILDTLYLHGNYMTGVIIGIYNHFTKPCQVFLLPRKVYQNAGRSKCMKKSQVIHVMLTWCCCVGTGGGGV